MSTSINRGMKARIRFIMFTALFMCVPLIVDIFYLQIIQHDFYQSRAIEQQTKDMPIQPKRGKIYDRNLKTLAMSATAERIYANPSAIKDDPTRELVATGLSEILGLNKDSVLKKLKQKAQSVDIKRQVEPEVADKVRQFIKDNALKCVFFGQDTKRYYPYGSFASTVIGFTNIDGKGIEGIESYYNDILQGTPGKTITATDRTGVDMPFQYEKYIDAQDGQNLVLTIDEVVQHFLEKSLQTAVEKNNVQNRASGIVINVKTGEILAMATVPDYDLNNPRQIIDPKVLEEITALPEDQQSKAQQNAWAQMWRNKAISDTYEPGSVFKVITGSMALEEGVVKASDTFNCPGFFVVTGTKVRCWRTIGHGTETFVQGLMNSCNVVFMQVGARVGAQNFSKYFSAFGLREKTGIDLNGETNSIAHSEKTLESPISLAVSSFGQTFKITPIQMITAISAVANGGNLVTPHLAKAIVDDNGNLIKAFDTQVKRQVISAETSKAMCEYMGLVVSQGTGKNAYVPGYRVGGKTATSEKIDEKNEQGIADKRIASFCGIAPWEDPQIAVLILLDEPNVPNPSGGIIAAPVVRDIMSDILPYLGVTPKYTEAEMKSLQTEAVSLTGLTVEKAKSSAKAAGFTLSVSGGGDKVISQTPKAGTKMSKGGKIIAYTDNTGTAKLETVPDVYGLPAAEAVSRLQNAGFNVKTGNNASDGSAIVTKQDPVAGSTAERGSVVSIEFTLTDIINDSGSTGAGD